MKVVGDHLARIAANAGDLTECDRFCRSAFNRYYYSAFLAVRSVLKTIDPIWATPSHQSVPQVLTGAVLRRLKVQIRMARHTGQIGESEGAQLYSAAAGAASELSNLLTAARETRRIADYVPETRVVKIGSVMKLADCSLETARNWERRVDIQAKTILKIYGRLGTI